MMMMMMTKNFNESTYNNDAEVEYGPEAGEVFLEAEAHPLKQHLNGEDDRVEDVHDVQDILQPRLLIQIDVLKTLQHTMQCNAMQCNAMQCNAMQCNAMQCNAMQCNAMQCNAMQYNTRLVLFTLDFAGKFQSSCNY